jgi:hypothetical protein
MTSSSEEKDKFTSPKILKKPANNNNGGLPSGKLGHIDSKNNDTFDLLAGIADPSLLKNKKAINRWSVEDMFKANSKLTGKEYDYDGNPHSFGSSHPKFVDYRKYSELMSNRYKSSLLLSSISGGGQTAVTEDDLDFQHLSLQSHALGEKLLRGNGNGNTAENNHGNSGGGPEPFALPVSAYEEFLRNSKTASKVTSAFQPVTILKRSSSSVGGMGGGSATASGTATIDLKKDNSSFFQRPFVFDLKDIMTGIEESLAKNPIQWVEAEA